MTNINGRRMTFRQADAMVIAKVVRNAMEDFHHDNLSDGQMKQLNRIIRDAIYVGLMIVLAQRGFYKDNDVTSVLEHDLDGCWNIVARNLPSYWELPNEKKLLDELGKLI